MAQKIALRRELRTWETLALSVAMMSPVLALSLYGGAPAIYVGSAAPLAFVISGLAVALVGAGLVYLCRYFSHAGSVYGLTGVTLGPRAGFFSGWALMGTYMIYTPASAATAGYFATLFLKDTGIWTGADYFPITVAFLVGIYFLSTRDIKKVGRLLLSIEGIAIVLMLIVVTVVTVRLIGGFQGNGITTDVFKLPQGTDFHALVLASVFGFSAFAGFEGAASLGEETKNPRKAIPKALTIAIVAGVVLYVLVVSIMSMGFGTADGGAAFAKSSGPLFDLSRTYIGSSMAEALELGALISAFSAALGTSIGGGRMIFALTRDARPDSALCTVNDKGVPINAIRTVVVFALVANTVARIWGASGLESSFYLGTIGTLSLLVAYAMVDLGAIRLMLKTAKNKSVILIPAAGFAILCYVMFNQLYPSPPAPYRYFPYVVAVWLIIPLVIVLVSPRLASRIGTGLAEAEGMGDHEPGSSTGTAASSTVPDPS